MTNNQNKLTINPANNVVSNLGTSLTSNLTINQTNNLITNQTNNLTINQTNNLTTNQLINSTISIYKQYSGIDIYNTNCIYVQSKACYVMKIHGRIYNELNLDCVNIFNKNDRIDRTHYFYTYGNKFKNSGLLMFSDVAHTIDTDRYGHFEVYVHLSANYVDGNVKNNLLNFTVRDINRCKNKHFVSNVIKTEDSTAVVISDIDDTIKYSNVLNKLELVENTFYREFIPNRDMLNKFTELKNKYNISNYHYVSASPWQLYEPLDKFIGSYYPKGTIYLTLVDIDNFETLVDFVLARTIEYKIDVISHIIEMCPNKKYILIGDDGEHDPEIYVTLYNKYPSLIDMVIIRSVRMDVPKLLLRLHGIPTNKFEIIAHSKG